jgi:hypothetical protein
MNLLLTDLLTVDHPNQYKLHLACENEEHIRPLDRYVSGREHWVGWNQWRGNRNDWTRPYIFSLMEFYPRTGRWLFGGVFKLLDRGKKGYKLETVEAYRKFKGRLLFTFKRYRGMRGRAFYLENYIDQFEVAELLPAPYSGESFCGYAKIHHDFGTLEPIFENERAEWKAALSSVKGIYAIFDKSNGKKYVGSAYGEVGIWSRWACYIGTGHGWNDELTKLIALNGIEYARENFIFSILETATFATSNLDIIEREGHWKRVLHSNSKQFGYNRN